MVILGHKGRLSLDSDNIHAVFLSLAAQYLLDRFEVHLKIPGQAVKIAGYHQVHVGVVCMTLYSMLM